MLATLGVILFVATTVSVTTVAQAPSVSPGRYENVTETLIPGRATKTPGRKTYKCLTVEDLKDWNNLVRGTGSDEREGCKVVDRRVTATTVAFTKECSNPGGTFVAKVDITVLGPDSYQAVVKTSQSSGRANALFQDMTITSTAKRLGDCTK
jgi:hypothetical protein